MPKPFIPPPPLNDRRVQSPGTTVWKTAMILILFIAAQFVAGLLSLMWVNWKQISEGGGIDWLKAGLVDPFALGLSYWLAYLLLFVLLWTWRLTSEHPFGSFRRGRPRHAYPLIFAFLLLAMGLSFLITPLNLDDMGSTERFTMLKDSPIALALLCVGGPAIEEVVFRDGIQRQLTLGGSSKWVAICVSATTFGVIHVNMAQGIPAILLGIALGQLYHRTGDLRICLPAHILNNTIAMAMLYIPAIDNAVQSLPLIISLPLAIGLIGSAVGIFHKFALK